MHRIDTSTAQVDKFGPGKNGFTNGDKTTGRRATDLNSDMWDAVQEEICAVIESSGLVLNKEQHDQLYQAIVKIINSKIPDALLKKNNLSDVVNKALALSNIGGVPSTRKVNGKALSGDITLSADDVVAVPGVIRGVINGSMPMASANKNGWWQVAVPDTSKVSDFPKKPNGSTLYGYGYMFVWVTGNTWFQHYIAHHGEVAYRQDWNAGPSESVEWNVEYNTANKPTATEVDAVSASGGGTFKGAVNFNNVLRIDKSYPGLALRDADADDSTVGKDVLLESSGGNARLLFRKKDSTDNQLMLSFPKVAGTLYSTGNKPSAGDVGSYTKAECDARYVADVQLGAGTRKTTWNTSGNWPNTAGYVITSVWKDAQGDNLDGVVYAPLQKKIGSTWYTVSGGLA